MVRFKLSQFAFPNTKTDVLDRQNQDKICFLKSKREQTAKGKNYFQRRKTARIQNMIISVIQASKKHEKCSLDNS